MIRLGLTLASMALALAVPAAHAAVEDAVRRVRDQPEETQGTPMGKGNGR